MDQVIAGRYRVIRVLPEENGVAYCAASDGETGQICLLSAVSGRSRIRRCLKELSALPEGSGYLGCFLCENTLFVKTKWQEGRTLRSALSENRLSFRERLLLVQRIFTEALSWDFLPDVLRDSLFCPDGILTEGDDIVFRLRIRTDREEGNSGKVPSGARELLMEVFSHTEQSKHGDLYLTLEKLKREVTSSLGELLHDIGQILAKEDQRSARHNGRRKRRKRFAALGKAAALMAAAGLAGSLLSCGGEKKETAAYQDITAIGSVQLTDGGGEP